MCLVLGIKKKKKKFVFILVLFYRTITNCIKTHSLKSIRSTNLFENRKVKSNSFLTQFIIHHMRSRLPRDLTVFKLPCSPLFCQNIWVRAIISDSCIPCWLSPGGVHSHYECKYAGVRYARPPCIPPWHCTLAVNGGSTKDLSMTRLLELDYSHRYFILPLNFI